MCKRKYKSPDGLDWRDPNMPVLRYGKVNGIIGNHVVQSQHIQQYYAAKMNDRFYAPPSWRDDPSYFWSVKNRR